jgi:hypothetical protein
MNQAIAIDNVDHPREGVNRRVSIKKLAMMKAGIDGEKKDRRGRDDGMGWMEEAELSGWIGWITALSKPSSSPSSSRSSLRRE